MARGRRSTTSRFGRRNSFAPRGSPYDWRYRPSSGQTGGFDTWAAAGAGVVVDLGDRLTLSREVIEWLTSALSRHAGRRVRSRHCGMRLERNVGQTKRTDTLDFGREAAMKRGTTLVMVVMVCRTTLLHDEAANRPHARAELNVSGTVARQALLNRPAKLVTFGL
jgi:hypothetical protein